VNKRRQVVLTAAIARAARGRFRHALKSRYAATGLSVGDDIARVLERRTGVPFAAIVADQWGRECFVPIALRVPSRADAVAHYAANVEVEE
jgi:hypothetical protein